MPPDLVLLDGFFFIRVLFIRLCSSHLPPNPSLAPPHVSLGIPGKTAPGAASPFQMGGWKEPCWRHLLNNAIAYFFIFNFFQNEKTPFNELVVKEEQ